jgi:hypothetical protein
MGYGPWAMGFKRSAARHFCNRSQARSPPSAAGEMCTFFAVIPGYDPGSLSECEDVRTRLGATFELWPGGRSGELGALSGALRGIML